MHGYIGPQGKRHLDRFSRFFAEFTPIVRRHTETDKHTHKQTKPQAASIRYAYTMRPKKV